MPGRKRYKRHPWRSLLILVVVLGALVGLSAALVVSYDPEEEPLPASVRASSLPIGESSSWDSSSATSR